MILVILLCSIIAYFLLGIVVLVMIDDRNESLYRWLTSAPLPGLFTMGVACWPIIFGYWVVYKIKEKL